MGEDSATVRVAARARAGGWSAPTWAVPRPEVRATPSARVAVLAMAVAAAVFPVIVMVDSTVRHDGYRWTAHWISLLSRGPGGAAERWLLLVTGLAVAVVAVLLAAQLVGRPVPAASTARTWLLAAAVSLPLWIGPIAEQLRHGSTGNVWSILRFSRSGAVARTGLGDAASAGLRAFRPVPTWLGGTDAVTGVGDRGVAVWLVVVVVAVAACLLVRARRREGGSVPVRDRVGALAPPVTAVVVSSVALVAAVVVLGTGRGPVRFYYVLHIEAAAFALVAATGWLVVDTALGSARPVPVAAARAGRVVCWTALAVASVVLGVRAVGGLTPTLGVDHLVGPAVEAVQDRAAAGQRVVVSRAAVGGAEPEFGLSMGFLDALDAAGVDVAVGPDVDASTGSRAGPGLQVAVPSQLRAEGSRRGDLTLLLLDGDPAAAPAGWERIGTISPTSTVWERPPPS